MKHNLRQHIFDSPFALVLGSFCSQFNFAIFSVDAQVFFFLFNIFSFPFLSSCFSCLCFYVYVNFYKFINIHDIFKFTNFFSNPCTSFKIAYNFKIRECFYLIPGFLPNFLFFQEKILFSNSYFFYECMNIFQIHEHLLNSL